MTGYTKINTSNAVFALPRITECIWSSVNSSTYVSSGKNRPNETHCIFHYTLSGSGETWIGNKIYTTKTGFGFLNVINDPNSGYRYSITSTENWEFIVICFDFGNARAIIYELIEQLGPIFQINDASVIFDIASHGKNGSIANISAKENYALFSQLLAALLENPKIQSNTDSNLVDNVKNYIAANLSKSISVNEISEHLKISREHLSRVFKAQTNESLKEYIDHQRIQYILQLLSLPELSIKQISEKCGFSSISNFASFVKKHSNKTPSAFKKHNI